LNLLPAQLQGLQSFGSSLASNVDVDGNTYNGKNIFLLGILLFIVSSKHVRNDRFVTILGYSYFCMHKKKCI